MTLYLTPNEKDICYNLFRRVNFVRYQSKGFLTHFSNFVSTTSHEKFLISVTVELRYNEEPREW